MRRARSGRSRSCSRSSSSSSSSGRRACLVKGRPKVAEQLPEYRRPWYQRWTGVFGEPRRRWRALDETQRGQANWVFKALLVIVVFVISWPLGLLVVALFGANYVDEHIPDKYAWLRRALIPTII